MVTKSTDNYDLWKEETKEKYYAVFPNKKDRIDNFIRYMSSILDEYKRSFIPRQVMFYLWGKRNWVINNNQHFWIGIIGKKGGEGKSTIADYISMIFDPTYHKDRSQQDYKKWLHIITKAKKETNYPAVVLDEPDNQTHELSVEGRERKDILERIRILKLFVCVCANSLSSIPPSIYERLGAIIYINGKHRFWLWDSSKDKPKETVVDDIKGKDGWAKYRHAVFRKPEFTKRAHFKNLGFTPPSYSPFKSKTYEIRKEEDVLQRIDTHLSKSVEKSRLDDKDSRITKEILSLKERYPKLTDGQIGLRLGLSRQWVNSLKNKAVKCQPPQL